MMDIVDDTFTVLGILLGVQMLIDGISLLLVGRIHRTEARDDRAAKQRR